MAEMSETVTRKGIDTRARDRRRRRPIWSNRQQRRNDNAEPADRSFDRLFSGKPRLEARASPAAWRQRIWLTGSRKIADLKLYETPVGFKYIGELINKDEIILGGEESAGFSIKGHYPEKDGILACLLAAEAVAVRKASLTDQLNELYGRVGQAGIGPDRGEIDTTKLPQA